MDGISGAARNLCEGAVNYVNAGRVPDNQVAKVIMQNFVSQPIYVAKEGDKLHGGQKALNGVLLGLNTIGALACAPILLCLSSRGLLGNALTQHGIGGEQEGGGIILPENAFRRSNLEREGSGVIEKSVSLETFRDNRENNLKSEMRKLQIEIIKKASDFVHDINDKPMHLPLLEKQNKLRTEFAKIASYQSRMEFEKELSSLDTGERLNKPEEQVKEEVVFPNTLERQVALNKQQGSLRHRQLQKAPLQSEDPQKFEIQQLKSTVDNLRKDRADHLIMEPSKEGTGHAEWEAKNKLINEELNKKVIELIKL